MPWVVLALFCPPKKCCIGAYFQEPFRRAIYRVVAKSHCRNIAFSGASLGELPRDTDLSGPSAGPGGPRFSAYNVSVECLSLFCDVLGFLRSWVGL